MGPQDDQMERLCAGDVDACEQFVHARVLDLYGWLYRLTGCREEAEDLCQEAFAAFWESIRRKRPPAEAHVWLFAIARNLWQQHCRRYSNRPQPEHNALEHIPASGRSALEVLEQDEMLRAIEAAVAELATEFREAFSLRAWHNMAYAEIAAIQGVSPGLARWRFFRARQQLREQLGHWVEDGEESHDEEKP